MQDWLNRIGLILQFIALFLVTPEILNEKRLLKLSEDVWVSPKNRLVPFARRHRILIAFAFGFTFTVIQYVIAELFGFRFDVVSQAQVLLYAVISFAGFVATWLVSRAFFYWFGKLVLRMARSSRDYLYLGVLAFTIGFGVLFAATFIHAD